MKRRFRRPRIKKRRKNIKASNWAPMAALAGTILAGLAAVALVLYLLLPIALPFFGIHNYRPPFAPTPTAAPTPRPTPSPRPIETADLTQLQHEVVFTGSTAYSWLGDPYCYGGKLMFTAGQLVETDAHMNALYLFDPAIQDAVKVDAPRANTHYMHCRFNDAWIVYLDANMDGGGRIMALPRDGGDAVVVKDVYTGQPKLQLDGDYLAWMERTGSRMDKLFVCDLATLESTTVQMFSDSPYGQSDPSLNDGLLVWADAGDSGDVSQIFRIRLSQSTATPYSPGTYVHDPQANERCLAWLDGHHGSNTSLYCSVNGGAAVLVDTNVIEFALTQDFIAYGKDERVYIYFYGKGTIYPVTPERELAQFLGAFDGYVIWMDVTSRERDIMKYAYIE